MNGTETSPADLILNLISDCEIFLAAIGALTFAISYAVFFNWRKTAAGRALMYFVWSLIVLCLLNALGRWLGNDYWGRPFIRITIYTSIVFTIWHLVQVLWRNWRSGSNNPLDIQSRDVLSRKHKGEKPDE